MCGAGGGDAGGKEEEQDVGHEDGALPPRCGRAFVLLSGWRDWGKDRGRGGRAAGCSSHALCVVVCGV